MTDFGGLLAHFQATASVLQLVAGEYEVPVISARGFGAVVQRTGSLACGSSLPSASFQ